MIKLKYNFKIEIIYNWQQYAISVPFTINNIKVISKILFLIYVQFFIVC